jgi:hypothetical protein
VLSGCSEEISEKKERRGKMKTLVVLSFVLLLTASLSSAGHAEVTYNAKEWTDMIVDIPCSGDVVQLEGYMHVMMSWTVDDNGGIHGKIMYQPMNLAGEVISGPNMGAGYNATGVTQDNLNGVVGEAYTYINNYRMIGKGDAPNLMVHETYHVTVNADGDPIVEIHNYSITCK